MRTPLRSAARLVAALSLACLALPAPAPAAEVADFASAKARAAATKKPILIDFSSPT